MIEKGRHLVLDRPLRNCRSCVNRNVYTIEDEYNFLMVCPQYEDIRYKYFPENMLLHVNLDKFYSFINSKNADVIIALGKFLYYAFKRQKSLQDNQ